MAELSTLEVDYGALVESPPPPKPDRRERESLTIRAPIELLQRARAAAAVETSVLDIQDEAGVVTLNKVIVHSLQLYLDAFEKANGDLPAPKKGSRDVREYAEKLAKKRGH